MLGLVDVGQHWQPGGFAYFGEYRQTFLKTKTARGLDRSPVRLVEAGFVDNADAELFGHLGQTRTHFQRVCPRFELAGSGDQRQGLIVAHYDFTDPNLSARRHGYTSRD